jgi:hypothetical protein
MAICHYTVFENLARGLQKIEAKSDDFKFSEEIYANLQRAAELAGKLVALFNKIYKQCTGRTAAVDITALQKIKDDLQEYRDLLHHPRLATAKDGSQRLIPRRAAVKAKKYELWTAVMYGSDPADFVDVEKQLREDFNVFCAALQDIWGAMQSKSVDLIENSEYLQRRAQGSEPPAASVFVPMSASGSCGPISTSGVNASATVAATVVGHTLEGLGELTK